jgi:hypothetical protein
MVALAMRGVLMRNGAEFVAFRRSHRRPRQGP